MGNSILSMREKDLVVDSITGGAEILAFEILSSSISIIFALASRIPPGFTSEFGVLRFIVFRITWIDLLLLKGGIGFLQCLILPRIVQTV